MIVCADGLQLNSDELNFWLSKLVEVRMKDAGAVYPSNRLYQLRCGLQRFLRDIGRPALNVFTEPTFKHFQDCLDAEMKRLTRAEVGSRIKEAQPFSGNDENKLWDLGAFGISFS